MYTGVYCAPYVAVDNHCMASYKNTCTKYVILKILTAKSGAKMQNIDTYFHPNPPVVGQPLTLHLSGVICK